MDFLHVRLHAPAHSLPALADFYGVRLGMERLEQADDLVAVRVGETRLEFVPSAASPFYHFALLAPGNRFGELLDWAEERVELLPDMDSDEVVFDFSDWGAQAFYFDDPAGNIVEAIVHRGLGETSAKGSFAAEELLGFSELGLVGDTAAMAELLVFHLGLELWDGTVEHEGRLAFVGEPAKTLILCPEGRRWLPTGRPAEPHPVEVVLSGPPEGQALIRDSLYRIRREMANDLAAQ
jgi:catechol 2,3-dioxygenase-like lactoylglutathione lyase family enzyme